MNQKERLVIVGGNALDLGLAESSLRDGFMDFFRFNNQNWYGCAREIDGSLYFYATRLTALWQNLLRNRQVAKSCRVLSLGQLKGASTPTSLQIREGSGRISKLSRRR